jgi:hypothetical protein
MDVDTLSRELQRQPNSIQIRLEKLGLAEPRISA